MPIIRPAGEPRRRFAALAGSGSTDTTSERSSDESISPLRPRPWFDARSFLPQPQFLPPPPDFEEEPPIQQLSAFAPLAPPQYPYQNPYQTSPIGQEAQQWYPNFHPDPTLKPIVMGSEDHELALPPPKRRKALNSDTEVISLLSDDEENSATIAAPPQKEKKPTCRINQSRFEHPPPLLGLQATKAQVKSLIKQNSSMPPESNVHPMDVFGFIPTLMKQNETSYRIPTPPPSSPPKVGPMSGRDETLVPMALVVPEEPPLCPEQARLVELITSGKNVFYTGSAGCGKSTVLKAFTKRLRDMGKNVRIVAPTGRAALQVNGSTTWTYAGWTPDHHKRSLDELKAAAHGKFAWKRFKDTDVLVIDEISMVENLHFERLNEIMKAARYKSFLQEQPAFGGVQVVVTGDFCQLPPVKPFQHCIQCGFELAEKNTIDGRVHVCRRHGEYRDEDKWAFRSKAWAECDFVHVHLNTIHRQNDETFIRILQKCRIGRQLSSEDTDLLMNHECMVHHATKLFATREEVANVNRREFERLKTINHTYWCLDNFIWQQGAHPHLGWKGMRKPKGPQSEGPLKSLEDHRFDECVQLKKGMLVVLLINLDLECGLCNGSQGIICGFERNDPKKLPQVKTSKNDPDNKIYGDRAPMKEDQIKKFIDDPGVKYKTWPIVRFHNGHVRTVYADCSIAELGDERPYSLLIRTQIPLAPAWAMTIHKSQSLTLDRVVVNLSRAFEEGQVYVALSRATGLRGLKIEGDAKGLLAGLGGNPEVQAFLREKFGDMDDVVSSAA